MNLTKLKKLSYDEVAKCNKCGFCLPSCPVYLVQKKESAAPRGRNAITRAVIEGRLELSPETEKSIFSCLGCGACYPTCNLDAISMRARDRRVYTPETTFDRVVAMAIERGKLAETVFANPEQLSYRALGRVVQALEKSQPMRAAAAVKPLRSAFMQGVVGNMSRFVSGI